MSERLGSDGFAGAQSLVAVGLWAADALGVGAVGEGALVWQREYGLDDFVELEPVSRDRRLASWGAQRREPVEERALAPCDLRLVRAGAYVGP